MARLEEPAPGPDRRAGGLEDAVPAGAKRTTFWPSGRLLYDPYLVAPRQSRTAVKLLMPVGRGEHVKIENTLGFHRSMVRWTSEESPDAGSELQLEGAVFARFDLHEHYDMDASDWRFGIPFVRRDGDLAWKIHLYHLTSHLGDEYMARVPGSKQLKYHLEEAAAGVSWDASAGSRLYAEAAAALYTGTPTDNGRVQVGYEWVGSKGSSGLSPWFAVDLTARHEQDWNPGKTVGAGVAYGRNLRFGLEFFHGRDTQTQFLRKQVRFVSVTLSIDF